MFEPVAFDDDDGQPEEDHVAADLGRRLGQPEEQERAGSGRPRARRRRRARAGSGGRRSRPSRGRAARAAGASAPRSARRRRADTKSTSRRSSGAALEQDVAAAGLAAQADVGAEPVDEPGVPPHGCGAAEANDVAEEQHEDGTVWHRRVRVSKARPTMGRDEVRVVAGSSSRSTGVTVTMTSGLRRRELGDDAAGPGQRAGQLVRGADRRELEAIAQRARRRAPRPPARRSRRRRSRPARRRPRSPRRRRCAAR